MPYIVYTYTSPDYAGSPPCYEILGNEPGAICGSLTYQSGIAAFAVPNSVTPRDARQAIKARFSLYPSFLDDHWCSKPEVNPGGTVYPYYGWYLPAHARTGRVVDPNFRTQCPHCAAKAAASWVGTVGTDAAAFFVPTETYVIGRDFLPTQHAPEVSTDSPFTSSATLKDGTYDMGQCCSNCGIPGHRSSSCDRHAKFHDRIGIEIEGRFLNLRRREDLAESDGMDHCGDGSLRESTDSDAEPHEFKTRPGNLREVLTTLVEYYPDETDHHCGMHVHISFTDMNNITMLNTTAFFAYFKRRWEEWGERMGLHQDSEFFKRLRGENQYCEPNEVSRTMTGCERYSQLNFSAFERHKTMECRLLPMFRRSSLGIAAVKELVLIVEDYLADPEAHGFVWADAHPVGLDEGLLAPRGREHKESFALDLPPLLTHSETAALEMGELEPPMAGLARIAMPTNRPITLESLAARLRKAA
jgi:hypothetical protein